MPTVVESIDLQRQLGRRPLLARVETYPRGREGQRGAPQRVDRPKGADRERACRHVGSVGLPRRVEPPANSQQAAVGAHAQVGRIVPAVHRHRARERHPGGKADAPSQRLGQQWAKGIEAGKRPVQVQVRRHRRGIEHIRDRAAHRQVDVVGQHGVQSGQVEPRQRAAQLALDTQRLATQRSTQHRVGNVEKSGLRRVDLSTQPCAHRRLGGQRENSGTHRGVGLQRGSPGTQNEAAEGHPPLVHRQPSAALDDLQPRAFAGGKPPQFDA